MKATTINIITSKSPRVQWIISTLIGRTSVFALLLLLTINFYGQQSTRPSLGAALYGQVSSNGYGSMHVVGMYVRHDKNFVFGGLRFQKNKGSLSGFQLGYSYSVTGKPCNESAPELYFFASAAYDFDAKLGKRALWEEHMANKYAEEIKVEQIRFTSVELFAGFGLRIHFWKKFTWDNSLGLGGYDTFHAPDRAKLYHERTNAGVQLRTGITLRIY